jgi:hypothetical protein
LNIIVSERDDFGFLFFRMWDEDETVVSINLTLLDSDQLTWPDANVGGEPRWV